MPFESLCADFRTDPGIETGKHISVPGLLLGCMSALNLVRITHTSRFEPPQVTFFFYSSVFVSFKNEKK